MGPSSEHKEAVVQASGERYEFLMSFRDEVSPGWGSEGYCGGSRVQRPPAYALRRPLWLDNFVIIFIVIVGRKSDGDREGPREETVLASIGKFRRGAAPPKLLLRYEQLPGPENGNQRCLCSWGSLLPCNRTDVVVREG